MEEMAKAKDLSAHFRTCPNLDATRQSSTLYLSEAAAEETTNQPNGLVSLAIPA